MTLNSMTAMFIAMISLAAIPSTSVLLVIARSVTSGFYHGVLTSLGILLGDFVFILVAIYGLSAIANTLENFLIPIKYLGAAYLLWTGITLCRTKPASSEVKAKKESSRFSSFITGLLITLVDVKAIFFYLSFFPAFLNLKQVTLIDTISIMAIATVSIGGVKTGYAYLASQSKLLLKNPATKTINQTAGSLMVAISIFLIATA